VPVGGPAALAAAVSRRGTWFAVLHEGGGVEVWTIPPPPRRIPLDLTTFSLVGVSDGSLYFFQDIDALLQVSRATGVARELLEAPPPPTGPPPPVPWGTPLGVSELDDGLALIYSSARRRLGVIDLQRRRLAHVLEGVDATSGPAPGPDERRDGGRRAADGGPDERTDERTDERAVGRPRQLIARGRELAAFDPRSGAVTPLHRFPAPILALDLRGDVALARGQRQLWRLTLSSGAIDTLELAAEPPLAIDDDGVAWLAVREGVVRWDGTSRRTIALPAAVNEIVAHRWLGLLVLDSTGALHVLDRAGAVVRSVAVEPYARISRDWPYALWIARDRAAVVLGDLVGGEHVALPYSDGAATTMLADRDGAVIVVSMLERAALVFPRLLPHDVAALPAWLDTATNAEISLDSSEPRWKLAPPSAIQRSAAP
jgi:hypothetical protein